MARLTYRANVSAANFPTDPNQFGRSVIMKQQDQDYNPILTAKDDIEDDPGIPVAIYVENALPTPYGYKSVQPVIRLTQNCLPFGEDVNGASVSDVWICRNATDTETLLHTLDGDVYRFDSTETPLPYIRLASGLTGSATRVTLNGRAFMYFANQGCYEYNFTTNTLDSVTLTGLTASAILGIASAGGYLIAYTETSVAWSSVTDPTDFVPSLVTGAGSGSVEGLQGAITIVVSSSKGLYVFTALNCVSGLLTGNARYPFTFTEIPGALGITLLSQVTSEGGIGYLYAITLQGVQRIDHKGTSFPFPHLSGAYPTWDSIIAGTWVPSRANPADKKLQKIVLCGDRYLCISSGEDIFYTNGRYELKQAFVYDIALKRWGRLVFDHIQLYDTGRESYTAIGILDGSGIGSSLVHFAVEYSGSISSLALNFAEPSKIIFGRFQHVRTELIELHEVEVENLFTYGQSNGLTNLNVPSKVYVQASLDGKTGAFTEFTRNSSASEYVPKYQGRAVGKTVSVAIDGMFNLNTLILSYNPKSGRR